MTVRKAEEGKVAEGKVAVDEKFTEAHRVQVAVDRPVLSDEAKARIVDLCRHVVRTDPGGTGKLATQILADLGVE
jgi:hypothetical protein